MRIPDWARVLRYIYQRDSPVRYLGDGVESDHPLVSDTVLDVEEANSALTLLSNLDLIEERICDPRREDYTEPDRYEGERFLEARLTKRGFDIANERELALQQALTNRALVFLTFGLLGVSGASILPTLSQRLMATIAVALVLILLLYYESSTIPK